MTTEEFIARAKIIHGDKYTYVGVVYTNMHSKVEILCNVCTKLFSQRAYSHVNGQGCPHCATLDKTTRITSTRLSTEDFISRAIEVHGNRYDYSRVKYTNSSTPVEIVCKKHGVFKQTLGSHVNNRSECLKCSYDSSSASRRDKPRKSGNWYDVDTKDFIEKAVAKHGDKYTYDKVEYKSLKEKVLIGCKIHGYFLQSPSRHLAGKDCRACSYRYGKQKIQKEHSELFKCRAKEIHNDRYDYSEVEYKTNNKKVKIFCKEHLKYSMMTPANHLQGQLTKCCSRVQCIDTESFIRKSKETHGDKYDYSKVVYRGSKVNVNIVCPTHGDFFQTPPNHSKSSGCPACGKYGFQKQIGGYFYVLQSNDITKIGITNNPVEERMKRISASSQRDFNLITQFEVLDGNTLRSIEQKLLRHFKTKYPQPANKFSGSTECFLDVNLPELINETIECIHEFTKGEINDNY